MIFNLLKQAESMAAAVAMERGDPDFLGQYAAFARAYAEESHFSFGVIETDDTTWEYARRLPSREGYAGRTLTENLTRLAEMHERIAMGAQL